MAEHNWMHTQLKPLLKLCTDRQHELWQRVSRGGFRGPLSSFDTTAPEGWKQYNVDITSLYPAASKYIEFETTLGKQELLKKYYKGFPDPSVNPSTGEGGWLRYDYQGKKMTSKEYDELENMHGIIKIRFDQPKLKFPFFY